MEFTYIPTLADWVRFSPELVMGATALMLLLVDLLLPDRARAWLAAVALLGVACAAGAVGYLMGAGDHGPAFFAMVTSDMTALFADAVLLATCGLAVLLSPAYIARQGIQHQGEYYTLIVLSTAGMMLMASATNLMTIFVGLELLSLCLYILCAYVARRLTSQEAGMKYFLLSSFASAFLLYGMALTYGATGSTSLDGIQAFILAHPFSFTGGYGPLLAAGFALLAVGFSFKVAGVPFHFWTPDVYVGAPTTVTAFMSVGTKVAAFVALARTFSFAFGPLVVYWQPIFWGVAVLTMVFGNILAITQSDVKRLLAYSSIAHAGYVLVGIATGTVLGFSAVLVYLASYCVMNIGAFGVVLLLERRSGQGTSIVDYAGLSRRHPALAAALAVCLFSLAGVPPSAGFIGKWAVFYAAIVGGHLELAIIGLVASMFGMYYYLRVIWAMYFTEPAPAFVVASVPAVGETPAVMPATATVGPAGAISSPAPLGPAVPGAGGTAVAVSPAPVAARPAMDAWSVTSSAPDSYGGRSAAGVVAGFAVAFAAVVTIVIGIVPGPLFTAATNAAQSLLH